MEDEVKRREKLGFCLGFKNIGENVRRKMQRHSSENKKERFVFMEESDILNIFWY